LTCVDPRRLPSDLVGREWNDEFLGELPTTVDPCGENGEFHTFCHTGPIFDRPIPIHIGAIVARDGFVFADATMHQP
jgi:diphthamide synthase (EF-2-diphthine--ammonia ligase)